MMPRKSLTVGMVGENVAALHHALVALGFNIPEAERKRRFFGPETRQAVRQCQTRNWLMPSGKWDEGTRALLNLPDESEAPPAPLQPAAAAPGLQVRAMSKDLRSEKPLGDAPTDADGPYEIRYMTEKRNANLVIPVLSSENGSDPERPLMADTKASDLSKCAEEVPLLGVTREFDFGQFIELFDSTEDPKHPDVPSISRIVIQPSSTLAAARNAATGSASSPMTAAFTAPEPTQGLRILGPTSAPAPQTVARGQEVNLFDLMERGPGAKLEPVSIEIRDRESFFKSGVVEVGGKNYKVPLDAAMRDAMVMGLTVTAYAKQFDGEGTIPVNISLPFVPIQLTDASLTHVLAGHAIDPAAGGKPVLTSEAIRVLLSGEPVLTHSVDAQGRKTPIALHPASSRQEPMADRFELFDLPSFIANPSVPAKNGTRLPVDLTPEQLNQLINTGRTQVGTGEHRIEITVFNDEKSPEFEAFRQSLDVLQELDGGPITLKPFGTTWPDITVQLKKYGLEKQPHFVDPYIGGARGGGTTIGGAAPRGGAAGTSGGNQIGSLSMIDKVQPRLPTGSGLPVAVFVPWKQTWTLKGFSRGNLLHSIALAPLEQVTMQVSSWERRSRSLEQSSETDIDQQTDVTQSTRDTEDVFKEMIAKRDFAWQLSGSIDASYSPGVASIKVSASGGVSETTSIQQTARNSSQSVKEATIKASSRVRSRRVTRVTQTVESGKEERVTRLIRNPNQCHTLTLDFFETLAHYEIKLEFVRSRLRLVVLVPNPITNTDFKSEIVRRNESALRNALIESALVDGFDACRLVAAYDEAVALVNQQKSDATKIDEMSTQRDQLPLPAAPDPAGPQQAEVERVVKEMMIALKKIHANAEIDTALRAIASQTEPVTESARQKGQQWLFIQFCAAKIPALVSTLDDLVGGSTAPMLAAQKILAVLPKPDAPTNLGNLNQMSAQEKEVACLSSKLRERNKNGQNLYMQHDWDWTWWTNRLSQESLYMSNDGGLGGLASQLQKAYAAWEGKKAQGEAMKDQDVAKAEAEGKQEKTTTEDKLSMAFPLEDLARAYERMKVLRDHFNEHREFYNYALFQALPPSEQALRIVEASNGKLQVGLFEPRVVAMSGSRLVVPLTPLAGSPQLQDFVTNLGNDLDVAFAAALATPDPTILPTPGVSISSRLGKCSGCEEYIETARKHELVRLEALANQEQREAERRQKRIDEQNYDDFREPPPAVKLEIESNRIGLETPPEA